MSLSAPSLSDRYAVVSPYSAKAGPADVSFWPDMASLVGLLTDYANIPWRTSQGFSVWHRRTAKSPWKLITNPT